MNWISSTARVRVRWAVPVALAAAVLGPAVGVALAQQQSPGSSTADASSHRALINNYCTGCHSQELKTAGLSLERLDLTHVGANAATWEKVLRKVSAGEMPPPDLPRPDPSAAASFTTWLESELDRAAEGNPNPGSPPVHRLNRAEYSNTIRDLLALDIDPGSMLPVDDSGYGFDSIAAVLSMSPALLERYMSAARMISNLAVGDLEMKPVEETYLPPRDPPSRYRRGTRIERVSPDLPFNSRGGLSVEHYFPLDAEYVFRMEFPNRDSVTPGDPPEYEFRVPVKAGLRTVGVTFQRESTKAEAEAPRRRGGDRYDDGPEPLDLPALMDLRLDGARLKLFEVPRRMGARPDVTSVSVAGPYKITGRGDTPSRERIFVCRPTAAEDEERCAHTILSTLARRAFRRPVTEADLRPLLGFYQRGRADGDFDTGIARALRAILMSPDFLFRVEQDPRGAPPATVYRLSDHELASRLSYFLWSSMPDDELLRLADEGKLKDPTVLRQQVRRMLADRRSLELVDNFAGQWLHLRKLDTAKPDPIAFTEFDESLRRSFRRETELLFETILREDRSVLDLLDADYTFLNERLGEHYGVPEIYGSQFRRVAVADPNRRGLLGQGSILTVTSYPNRTSVVQRGQWILENLLGAPPPPPPPDIGELEPQAEDGRLLTVREQMERHRADPTCASCHARMDPIGFALENYDAIGRWREKDADAVIDATGKLPDGTQFEGPAGLRKLLLEKYRDDFISTVTEKLLTYALGRGVEYFDQPVVRSITKQAAGGNYRMSELIVGIVESTPFQMRRTKEP